MKRKRKCSCPPPLPLCSLKRGQWSLDQRLSRRLDGPPMPVEDLMFSPSLPPPPLISREQGDECGDETKGGQQQRDATGLGLGLGLELDWLWEEEGDELYIPPEEDDRRAQKDGSGSGSEGGQKRRLRSEGIATRTRRHRPLVHVSLDELEEQTLPWLTRADEMVDVEEAHMSTPHLHPMVTTRYASLRSPLGLTLNSPPAFDAVENDASLEYRNLMHSNMAWLCSDEDEDYVCASNLEEESDDLSEELCNNATTRISCNELVELIKDADQWPSGIKAVPALPLLPPESFDAANSAIAAKLDRVEGLHSRSISTRIPSTTVSSPFTSLSMCEAAVSRTCAQTFPSNASGTSQQLSSRLSGSDKVLAGVGRDCSVAATVAQFPQHNHVLPLVSILPPLPPVLSTVEKPSSLILNSWTPSQRLRLTYQVNDHLQLLLQQKLLLEWWPEKNEAVQKLCLATSSLIEEARQKPQLRKRRRRAPQLTSIITCRMWSLIDAVECYELTTHIPLVPAFPHALTPDVRDVDVALLSEWCRLSQSVVQNTDGNDTMRPPTSSLTEKLCWQITPVPLRRAFEDSSWNPRLQLHVRLHRPALFTTSEDDLFVCAFDRFYPTWRHGVQIKVDWELIRTRFLPAKSLNELKKRFHNVRRDPAIRHPLKQVCIKRKQNKAQQQSPIPKPGSNSLFDAIIDALVQEWSVVKQIVLTSKRPWSNIAKQAGFEGVHRLDIKAAYYIVANRFANF